MHPVAALAVAYASGSIPSAWTAGRLRGVDLRKAGSGNLGATNVVRTLGPAIGAAVFAVDIAKGALPLLFVAPLTGLSGTSLLLLRIACGVAAILGHARPVFLGFQRGGKGVATSCGVFLALAPAPAAFALLTFAVVVGCSGYVSLASLSGALALPVLLAVEAGVTSPLFAFGVLAFGFVVWTHRENIARLRDGSEYRFNRSAGLAIGPSVVVGAIVIALGAAVLAVRGA